MSGCRPALLASDSTAFANVACTISSAAARSCMTPYTNRSNRNSCYSWSVAGRDASAETHESLSIVGDFPTNITLRRTDGRECFNCFRVVAIWDDTEQRSDHFGNAIWRMRRDSPSRPRPRGRPSTASSEFSKAEASPCRVELRCKVGRAAASRAGGKSLRFLG